MPKPKGGRGNTAPYETKLARIPLPLADQVSQLVERYQDFITQGGEAFSPPPLLDAIADDKPVNELEDAAKLVNEFREIIALKDQALEKFHLEKAEILLQWGQVIKERDELDQELNQLHEKNGDLNLEVEILKQQLADAANPVNEFELKEALATAEYWEATAKDTEKRLLKTEQKLASSLKAVNNLEKPVYELEVEDNKPVYKLVPLKAITLGKRLGYKDHSYVVRMKSRPDFTDWSQAKDPDHIGWSYDLKSKLFYPVG